MQLHPIDRSPISWDYAFQTAASTMPNAAADIRGLMPGLDTVLHDLAARFTAAAAG